MTAKISLTLELFTTLDTDDLLTVVSLDVAVQACFRLHHLPALNAEKTVGSRLVKRPLVFGQTPLILQQLSALITGNRVSLTIVSLPQVRLQGTGLLESSTTKLAHFLGHFYSLQDLYIQRVLSLALMEAYQVRRPSRGVFC